MVRWALGAGRWALGAGRWALEDQSPSFGHSVWLINYFK
jgi:hypothetical protein